METRQAIVELETTTFSAASSMLFVGSLDAAGARGGALALATEQHDVGSLYDAWRTSQPKSLLGWARDQVARGGEIFREPRLVRADGTRTSCASCHASPNVGSGAVAAATFDVGVSDASRRRADVPLYTLRNKATGELRQVTDPGRGLITGKWADIGRFKAPSLRDLGARAPYFHDGSAPTLFHVVDHYKRRFHADLDDADVFALVAFLSAL